MQQIEQGEILDRTYEERQRRPGDVEAVEGMGAIADQEKEFLLPGDQGVSLYRRQLRQLARNRRVAQRYQGYRLCIDDRNCPWS